MINLVLITSIINTPHCPLSYSKIRSVFSREQRFNDTKETIKSIKEKIPNCKIIIVECCDFSEEENDFFCKNCDVILNLWDRKDLHNNIIEKYDYKGKFIEPQKLLREIDSPINDGKIYETIKR